MAGRNKNEVYKEEAGPVTGELETRHAGQRRQAAFQMLCLASWSSHEAQYLQTSDHQRIVKPALALMRLAVEVRPRADRETVVEAGSIGLQIL